jgi:iron-sulfur cluster repair protein YtfE (RIC family)
MANLEEIIAAAAKVFRTKGYHAATVQDIADEVGILKGSLYHHVKSKEDLLYLMPLPRPKQSGLARAAADAAA